MRSYKFIEMYKDKNNLDSDYQASIMLGVTRQSISHYKNGRPLDEDLALPIAESLGIEPSEILMVIAAERSKKPEAKRAWNRLIKMTHQMGSASPILLIPLGLVSALIGQLYILC